MSFIFRILLVMVILVWKSESKSKGKDISVSIDLTNGWKPKIRKTKIKGEEFKAFAKVDNINSRISASSGGFKGVAHSGLIGGKVVAQAAIDMKLDKKKGVSAKISLPSIKGHAGIFGFSANLSTNIYARLKNNGIKVGIYGPSAKVKVGPFEISSGVELGIDASASSKEIGVIAAIPIGDFGVKVSCISKICIVACVSIKVC